VVYDISSIDDAYHVLGLERGSSKEDVDGAFRSLAIKYHPDKSGTNDTAGIFQEVVAARKYLQEHNYGADELEKLAASQDAGPKEIPYAGKPTYVVEGRELSYEAPEVALSKDGRGASLTYTAPASSYAGDLEQELAKDRYDAAGTNPFAKDPQEKAERGKLGRYWEGVKQAWGATTDAIGRGARAVGRGIESGIGYLGATYKTDSAKRARDLAETSRILGEARDSYLAGVLKTKAEIQGYANQIDQITPGAVDLFTEWL
jgi:hypothetical protein